MYGYINIYSRRVGTKLSQLAGISDRHPQHLDLVTNAYANQRLVAATRFDCLSLAVCLERKTYDVCHLSRLPATHVALGGAILCV